MSDFTNFPEKWEDYLELMGKECYSLEDFKRVLMGPYFLELGKEYSSKNYVIVTEEDKANGGELFKVLRR